MRTKEIIQKIKKGYRESGMVPQKGAYAYRYKFTKNDVGQCCPLTAFAFACGAITKKDSYDRRANKAANYTDKVLGKDFTAGFVSAIDIEHTSYPKYVSKDKQKGFEVGLKVRKEIFAK